MKEQLVHLSENIGFALATMKLWRSTTGVSSEVFQEALDRLDESHKDVIELLGGDAT